MLQLWYCCRYLTLCSCFSQGHSLVPIVLLPLTVQAQAAAILLTEPIQKQPVEFAGQVVKVVEGFHQAVALELGVFPMWSEVSLTVRHLARQAGFQGLSGAIHAKITKHISTRQLGGGIACILPQIGVIHLLLAAGVGTLHV